MRLAEFIMANRGPILLEWDAFAKTCTPAGSAMDITALADHANDMLVAIAEDLNTPQDKAEQSDKSKGKGPQLTGASTSAAAEHGAGRAESGFTIDQMVAEFRALRASVINLWTKSQGGIAPSDLDDLTRFNEAIDQSLAESVMRYTQDLDHSKEMFLAMLGHDLRSPLGAIIMSAKFMLETSELVEPHLTLTGRIDSSAQRMQSMIGDLLDFTRSRLGSGIPIERAEMNMGKAVHDVVAEISARYPGRTIKIDAREGGSGQWDCARISQVLTNLIGNAIEHGSETSVVTVSVHDDGDEVVTSVNNTGVAITPEQMNGIFGPMKSRETTASRANGAFGNLGLGLYIAERIVSAHRGRITAVSDAESGTTFTIHLPRS